MPAKWAAQVLATCTSPLSRLGVASRLLLAFLAISAFAVVVAGAAIYSYREIGKVLYRITAQRVPAALASQDVLRLVERIVAAAPALLSAATPTEHAERFRKIGNQMQALAALLEELEGRGADSVALGSMRSIASRLRINLEFLDKVIADRIVASELKRGQLRKALAVHSESQDLLAPWLQIVNGEIAQSRGIVDNHTLQSAERATAASRLVNSTTLHQRLQRIQFLITSVSDRLQQIATTDDADNLHVLVFRSQQTLNETRQAVADLDARLQLLLSAKLDALHGHLDGNDSIPGLRLNELTLIAQANRHLGENAVLSQDLTEAVDRLIAVANRDIAQANQDVLSVGKFNSTLMIVVVALCLLSSFLIVWRYVGRNIARRLTTLSDSMLAIADGQLHAPVAALGTDEIAAMGRAVEVFRKNTLERDELLAEKAQAAGLLEKQVKERTAELTEALEQQTATADILRVTSSSPDLQPVLDAVAEKAARLCEASDAQIYLIKDNHLIPRASHGPMPPFYTEQVLARGWVTGRAVVDRRTIHVHDLAAESEGEYPVGKASQRLTGHRTTLATPMLREGAPLGAILIRRMEVCPFVEKQIKLLETFADQAVIAIENARLFEEVQARTKELVHSVAELKALADVSQAVNSTINLETVLATIVTKAVQLSGTEAGTIYVFDEASREFQPHSTYGMDEFQIAGLKDRPIRMGDKSVVDEAAVQRTPVQIVDVQHDEASRVHDVILRAGFRALLTIPLLSTDRIVGALVVRRKEPGEFPKETIELLQTFATQSVLAIQNARLFREIQEKGREIEIASQHKSQFVANMSHELRTPLAAILGYAELMQEGFYGDLSEKATESLARIRSNGKHLLGLINTVLDIAKIESGQFSLNLYEYAIESVVETVRAATESLAETKKLALKTDVAERLPVGLGDEQRLTQVLLNLVGNAIKFTDTGEVRIVATAANSHFTVSVTDTGPGIAQDQLTRVFDQFHQVDNSNTKAKGGTGLGLAIAKQIVEMHGGRIWVESMLGQGATFQMQLPIRAEAKKAAG